MATLLVWFKNGKTESFSGVKNFNVVKFEGKDYALTFDYKSATVYGQDEDNGSVEFEAKVHWDNIAAYAISKKSGYPKQSSPAYDKVTPERKMADEDSAPHWTISRFNAPVSCRPSTSSVPLNPWT